MVLAPWRTPPDTKFDMAARATQIVDAAMLIKTLVFRGEDRVNQGLGNIVDTHQCPTLLAEFADELAVSAINPQRYLRAVIGE